MCLSNLLGYDVNGLKESESPGWDQSMLTMLLVMC